MKKLLMSILLAATVTVTIFAWSFDDIINEKTVKSAVDGAKKVSVANEDLTPEQEYYIGRAVAAQLLSQYKPLSNKALQTYLNKIAKTIALNSPRPEIFLGYRVIILDTNEINAFATPGGHILVSKGLIQCTESEEALAAVIAHEIAHIQLQHATKAIRSSRTTQALIAASQDTLESTGKEGLQKLAKSFDEGVGEIVNTLATSGYSKQQEYDADSTAIKLLTSAGYDPNGLLDMLNVLVAKQGNTSGGFNSTHPAPNIRLTKATISVKMCPKVTTQPIRTERFKAAIKNL